MHTLKVMVVDPAVRGSPLTAADVVAAIEANVDRYPRARQRIAAPFFGSLGRPYWVEDPELDVTRHVDERQLAAPGGRHEFDAALSDLAERRLRDDRPLWHVTLVHGLEHGRQALVCQVHHAVTDGSAAAAALEGLTTAEPGGEPEMPPIAPVSPERSLRATAIRQVPHSLAAVPGLVRDASRSNRRAAAFRDQAQHLPPAGWSQYRDTFLVRTDIGNRRVCATASLPLSDFQLVSRWAGVSLNGTLHGVIAGALRTERIRRGEDPSRPMGAAFGIALDDPDAARRRWGNNVSPTYVLLHTDEADPVERLRRTAASAREGVELRRHAGPDAIAHVSNHLPRFPAVLVGRLKGLLPAPAHLVTANVRGPDSARWIGQCEIVDWYSFAVIVPPLPANLTVYSYAGEMKFGLLSEPETFPEPARFVEAIEASLRELVELAS